MLDMWNQSVYLVAEHGGDVSVPCSAFVSDDDVNAAASGRVDSRRYTHHPDRCTPNVSSWDTETLSPPPRRKLCDQTGSSVILSSCRIAAALCGHFANKYMDGWRLSADFIESRA